MLFTLVIGGIGLFGTGVGASLAWLVKKILANELVVNGKTDILPVRYSPEDVS